MSPAKPKLTVAVNGLFLTRPFTGMGQYTRGLLTALPAALPGSEITVFVPEEVDFKAPRRVTVKVVPVKRHLLGHGVALDRWEGEELQRAAVAVGADLLHTPYPTALPESLVPTIMTVHDMISWQLPYYRRKIRSRLRLQRVLDGIREADALLTVSEAAAADIVRVSEVPEGRIQVAYESLNPEFKKPAKAAVTKARKEHRLNRPYVLYLGGFDYRKNVRRLVMGFGESGLAATHDLAIAGAEDVPAGALHSDYHRLATLLAQAGIQSKTRLIGTVTEADKAALLTGADAFCYPSLAEGFGLPILEALACGTPVAASRLPVTKELFTGAINFFDPMDQSDLAGVLKETVGSRPAAMQKRAKQIVKEFNWKDAADRTAAVYEAVSGRS